MTLAPKRRGAWRACAAAALALAPLLLAAGDAHAAGLYFSDRGVRPMGRGGAFVAGADDVGAIWYNPAGLADAGTSALGDFGWLHFTSEFTRRTYVADTAGTLRLYEFPTVNGTSPVLPIPTLGGSYQFGDRKQYTVAGGILAPYAAIATYPQTLDGKPAPSRYSLVSLDGSALVIAGAWFAYKLDEKIRLGGGLELLTGSFKTTKTFSASPADRLIGAPEDPTYDAFSELTVGPIFAPSANLGATIIPDKHVRLGASAQLPFSVSSPATVKVRLPTAPPFDKAYQQGEDAHVSFTLPAVVRLGVEFRPDDALRIEAAYVREFWSQHDAIDVRPDNIRLYQLTGFPSPFGVGPIHIPRSFQDSNSFRAGAEYTFPVADYKLTLRGGGNYETSGVPPAYVSALTIDTDKLTMALGGSLHIGKHWRLDAVFAHVFASDVTVSPSEAKEPRTNPVRGNPTETEAINGGTYSARADLIGVGANYQF